MRFVVVADAVYADLARMCIETIRHHHPLSHIVHMTDEKTPPLGDEVWRSTGRYDEPWYMRERHAMLAEMDCTPTAVIDSDTLICMPMDDLWQDEFDIALTWRPDKPDMPYNGGVIFCREPRFFAAVLKRMEDDSSLHHPWIGEQKALAQEAASGKWKVLPLTCEGWNNSNIGKNKMPKSRIVHYKGDRKQWMPQHFKAGLWKA